MSTSVESEVPSLSHGSEDENHHNHIGFYPNLTPAIVFLVAYTILTAALWYRYFRHKAKYMLVLNIGMICMTAGLVFRIVYSTNVESILYFLLQHMFLLLSPSAFLAIDYIILPLLASFLDSDNLLLFKSKKIVSIFITKDLIGFGVQLAGGAMLRHPSGENAGNTTIIIGLGIHLVSFLSFTILAISFGIRLKLQKSYVWTDNKVPLKHSWKLLYFTLLLTTIAIIIRSSFRFAEFFNGGHHSYLATHEVFLYSLDILPLFLAMSLYAIVWPPCFMYYNSHYGQEPEIQQDPTMNSSQVPLRQYNTTTRRP